MNSLKSLENNLVSSRNYGYLLLEVLFLGFLVFTNTSIQFSIGDFVLLALASFRGARTLSFNEVAAPLRAPFCEVKPDSCRAGSDVHPRGDGLQYVIGSLLACPICTGTWVSLFLVFAWLNLGIGRYLVYVLAIAGAVEVLHYVALVLEWKAREARVKCGAISPDDV